VRATYTLDNVRWPHAKRRRDKLKAEKVCINARSHGPATHGVRCEHCADVHKGTRDEWRKAA
jgi:hypothetical protein